MSEDQPTIADVVDKLQTLGSADHIALFFEKEHVTGVRSAAYDCPVATYIGSQTGAAVHATPLRIRAYSDCRSVIPDQFVELDGVGPLSVFMARFDAEAYPALDVDAEI